MESVPFLDAKKVPLNCIPICPSFQQTFNIEKRYQEAIPKSGKLRAMKADAMHSELDRLASGILDSRNVNMSLEMECLSGKMYFVLEFLRILENRKLGYTMISIVTTRPDVELALVKVLSYYISSQIVRIENVSLEGHGIGYFIGGVTVHVKTNQNMKTRDAAHTDLVLIYDADIVGVNFARVFVSLPFDCNPIILHLCTFGTPELHFRNFCAQYAKRKHIDRDTVQPDVIIKSDRLDLLHLLNRESDTYTNEEFILWNDSIALHVINWFLSSQGNDYQFRALSFPQDVPSKYFLPPRN